MFITKLSSQAGSLFVAGVLALALAWSTAPSAAAREVAGAQAADAVEEAAGESSTVAPVIKEYKGVRIGMTADEARGALGGSDAAKEKRDVFLVSDDEMAQLFFDKDGKLQAVSVTYLPKGDAPAATAVLGVEVAAGTDGRAYKLIRYPEAGYWVSYNRTAGDAPVVTVTMKKMATAR
jgi:hypothetical protein